MSQNQTVKLDTADILNLLAQGTLEVEGLLPYSSNYTLLAKVEHDSMCALAVYKPRRGERPLWDFPRGTLYRRECAAFLVSEALSFGFVPPTVIRNGPYGIGAMQLFIDNDPDEHLLTMQREPEYEETILRLAAFDYLINNADRKSGHCLKGIDGQMWAIDHGIAFHEEYKLRTVLWDFVGQPFPQDIATALQQFCNQLSCKNGLEQQLSELLLQSEMRALKKRLQRMIKSGVYPAPGDGPNIPWPPV